MERARVVAVLLTAALVQGCNCGVVVGGEGGGMGGGAGVGGGTAGGSGGGSAGGAGGGTAGGVGGGTAGGAGGGTAGGSGGGTAGGSGGGTAGGAGGGTAGGSGGGTAGGSGGGSAGGAGGGTAGGSGGGSPTSDAGVNIGCATVVPIRHDAGTMGGSTCAAPLLVPTVPALVFGDTRTGVDTQNTCSFGVAASERNYRVTVPTSGELTIELTNLSRDAGFVPVIGVYDNCQFNMGLPEGCLAAHPSEPATRVVVPFLDAGTYIVAVDGHTAASGDFSLAFCLRAPHATLTGDTCLDPAPLTFVNAQAHLEDNTAGMNHDVAFVRTSGVDCKGGSADEPADRVYSIDLPDAGGGEWDVQARAWTQTTDYTQPYLVFTDVCPQSGVLGDGGVLDCGTGSSALAGEPFSANLNHRFPAGRHYLWLEVASQSSPARNSGYALDVRYARVGGVANDACSTTTSPLLAPNTSYAGTLLGATSQLANPVCADNTGQAGSGAEVFYRYTAPATGMATFQIDGERALAFYAGVFSGCAATDCLTMVNPNGPSQTRFTFAVTQGTTYVVMVEEVEHSTGVDNGDGYRGAFGIRVSQ